jgi:hypothetical protein
MRIEQRRQAGTLGEVVTGHRPSLSEHVFADEEASGLLARSFKRGRSERGTPRVKLDVR